MKPPSKMQLISESDPGDRLFQLSRLFPEAMVEGRIDWDALRRTLGEWIDPGKERFGLNWPGKADCMRIIQQPSVGTLLPMRDESVNFDETQNVIIEGDNLEVLKLLQKSYYGKVKMIYIDPPYNTGNEFIYPDNFKEGLQDYLRYSGQTDEEGLKLTANSETEGRYHSKWLNMMYPRLFLARNLLRDDGVIFVSIDDHEVANLRALMNEVFGEENFIASVIWQRVFSPKNTARHFSEDHDYVLVFGKNADAWVPTMLPRTEEMESRYSNPDSDPRGVWASDNLTARNFYGAGTYAVTTPSGRLIPGPPSGTYWRVSQRRLNELDADKRIWWGPQGSGTPRLKRFLSEVKAGRVPQTLWMHKEVGNTQEAKKELLARLEFSSSDSVFDTPKPTRLIRRMLQLATKPDDGDLVLDFFAGSGTTGEAVLAQNAEDSGNRKYILVQLPEHSEDENFATIAAMARRRLAESQAQSSFGNDGFRSYRLSSSNFRSWSGENDFAEALQQQLTSLADNTVEGRSEEDILTELLLKAGFELTAPVEKLSLAGKDVFSVADGALLLSLDEYVTVDVIEEMVQRDPQMIICLDEGFRGNDELKVNAVQTVEARNRNAESDIMFRVV